MREVKIATAQFETTLDPEENRKKALRYCEEAARKGAQAICFAECARRRLFEPTSLPEMLPS